LSILALQANEETLYWAKISVAIIKAVKRVTRRQFNPDEKIAIVLEGLIGEQSIAEICRREGIAHSVYYS
jgi:transposase